MNDIDFSRAVEEIKRADHLYFVTLKYTRTADVISNTVKRLISSIEMAAEDALDYLKSKNKVKEIPVTNKERVTLLRKFALNDEDIEFYNFLKRIDRSKYTGKEEYRKNVALVTHFVEVDINLLGDYFERTKNIVDKVARIK